MTEARKGQPPLAADFTDAAHPQGSHSPAPVPGDGGRADRPLIGHCAGVGPSVVIMHRDPDAQRLAEIQAAAWALALIEHLDFTERVRVLCGLLADWFVTADPSETGFAAGILAGIGREAAQL